MTASESDFGGSPRFYNVHGFFLRVGFEDRPMLASLDRMLAPFACELQDAPASAYELNLRRGTIDPRIPPHLRRVWHGVLTDGPTLGYYGDASCRVLLLEGVARLDIDLPRRRLNIVAAAGQEDLIAQCLYVPMLCVLLPAVGQFPVHAAALARDQDGSAILLAGLSERGKTTSSLALAHSGLRLMTDDTCFVLECKDGCRGHGVCDPASPERGRKHRGHGTQDLSPLGIWGLRRQCRVRAGTFDLLPWLGALPRRKAPGDGPTLVELGDLWPASAARVRPEAIVLLDEPNPRGHLIEPVDKVFVCQELMRQNLHIVDPSAEGPAGAAMRMIARLVGQCSTWRLSAGPNLGELRSAIERVWPRSSSE